MFLVTTYCILSNYTILSAQNFPFRDYGVQDGLPQSQTTVIWQDSRGFLWIPTRNGLSRFDGIEFLNYYRKDGLPSNFASRVFEDNSGKIWALSAEGLSVYTGEKFKCFFQHPDSVKRLFGFELVEDNNGDFYILTVSSAALNPRLIKFSNGQYSDYSTRYPGLDTLRMRNIAFDNVNNELLIFDLNSQLWAWKDGNLKKLVTDKVDYLLEVESKIVLVSGEKIFDYSNKKISRRENDNPVGGNIFQNAGTVDFYYGNHMNRIQIPFTASGSFVDSEGNLWFSSESNIRRLLSTAFLYYNEDQITAQNIWTIAEDKNGHFWFGSLYDKLIEFDGKIFRERKEYKKLFKGKISFYKGSRRMLNGDNWFSTSDGVLIWDGAAFSKLKNIPENTQICYIYEDPEDNTIMLGTDKGLFVLSDGNIKIFSEYNDSELGVIEGITKDDTGEYWLSGHNGLVRFDGLNSEPVKQDLLPLGYTYTIEKDSHGGIWVTSDEGLFIRKKGEKSFIAGLPENLNNSANSICVMDDRKILVGRISDVCIIDLEKFYKNENDYFRIYDKTDGFRGTDCVDNGIIKDQRGRYWILASGIVIIFEPYKLKINNQPPRLNITGFHYQTDSMAWKDVEGIHPYYSIPDNIELNRFQSRLQITFNGISTTNPEKVRLKYRLIGYDDKWSDPSDKRDVTYERLSPGDYEFQILGFNADGIVTPEPLIMKFSILPAFWQTTLFIVTIAILILAVAVLIPVYIMKKWQDKKNEREKLRAELSRLQMNSVLKQFDPHFTFNVISSVGSLIMKGEKETAYEYITKLSGLLRTVLSDGSLIIKPLSVEIDFVRKYCDLQKLRFKGRFTYNIFIDQNADMQRQIPKMTIQTFVENSIKHGFEDRKEGGRVDIRIQHFGNDLEIKIIDNGIGRIAASRQNTGGTGHGLKIIKGLFEVMNDSNTSKSIVEVIDLEDSKGPSGTEVRIIIPDNFRFEFVPNK